MSQLEEQLNDLIKAHGLPEPVREYIFNDRRKWRFDFAWPEKLIAVEVEGGIWANGRHTRGKGFENDCRKYGAAMERGWNIYRVTGGMIESGEVIKTLRILMEYADELAALGVNETA